MKKYLLFVIFFVTVSVFSQNLDNYQYAIVPAKFDFLKEKDKYRLNTLTKLLMEKYGFVTYLSTDSQPDAIANTNCNKVFVDVLESGNLFVTKLKVVLKDCKNTILFTSEEGLSREKEFGAGFNEALRNAFKSFDKLNHRYNENAPSDMSQATETKIVEANFETDKTIDNSETDPNLFYFAQPIASGFQIVNSEPRVIMRLLNTSQKNVFIAVKDDTRGVVIFKNNQWFFEYYEGGKLVSEALKVKF